MEAEQWCYPLYSWYVERYEIRLKITGVIMTLVPKSSDRDRKYERSQDLVSRSVAGETLIVPVRGGVGDLNSIYTLRNVSQLIWQMVGEGRSFGEMVEDITKEYEFPNEQAEQDLDRFLDEMLSEKLIHRV